MDYKNRLKGSITQALVKSLLVDAGYHVVPLGIEEVIREVNQLDQDKYLTLDLPPALRKMPDFFVVDREYRNHYLVEVKYRRDWSKQTFGYLYKPLRQQFDVWGSFILLAISGDSSAPHNSETPAQFIRCARITGPTLVEWLPNTRNYIEGIHLEGHSGASNRHFLNETYTTFNWNSLYRVQDFFSLLSDQYDQKTIEKTKEMIKSIRNLDIFD